MNVENSAGLVHDVRELEQRHDALAVRRRPQQVHDVELGLAEEDVGALLLEHDDRAQQYSDRCRGHAAVVGQRALAVVGATGT